METVVHIPEKLEQAVKNYLEIHPEQTLSSLIQESLEKNIMSPASRLLELAGIYASSERRKRTPAEIVEDERERPEDEAARLDRR